MSNEAKEALQSLTDFHLGQWSGVARSFSVTADVAAGIVQRKTIPYTTRIQLGTQSEAALLETMEWNDGDSFHRSSSLNQSNMDVDAVDASYSLDATLPDFPTALAGTSKLPHFMIEHCIAMSDDQRARCFVLYGVDQNLIRVIVCSEKRIEDNRGSSTTSLSAKDLVEMQRDVDRLVDKITGGAQATNGKKTMTPEQVEDHGDRLNRLQRALDQSVPSNDDNSDNALKPHSVSLLELSSGVWLGDSIIRDIPMVPVSPLQRGKGFGMTDRDSKRLSTQKERLPFASWSVGVQKVAWRLMWNFGEEIRQVNDFGKAMGAELAEALTKDLSGSVCVNEGLSRRIPRDERMVYIDWNEDNVGFLIGSYSIQVKASGSACTVQQAWRMIQ